MTPTILIGLAGLMGAAGVVLLAAAAHAAPGAGLDSAGQMLLFHAVAAVAVAGALHQGLVFRPLAIAAAIRGRRDAVPRRLIRRRASLRGAEGDEAIPAEIASLCSQ